MASAMEFLNKDMCDYLMLRHVQVNSSSRNADSVPQKLYKRWKRRWVVLHSVLSPSQSFIGYCKSEDNWLSSSHSVTCSHLTDITAEVPSIKHQPHVLQINFKFYSIQLAFDSYTKRDNWLTTLKAVSERFHVDLVRSPEHPTKEGEYIIEVCPPKFRLWRAVEDQGASIAWDWHLRHLRRMHFHRNVNKLEVEAGRGSETGEGHFFFTGHEIMALFDIMKTLMTTPHDSSSTSSSPTSTTPIGSCPSSFGEAFTSRSLDISQILRRPSVPTPRLPDEELKDFKSNTVGSYPDLVSLSSRNTAPPIPPRDITDIPLATSHVTTPPPIHPTRSQKEPTYMKLNASTKEPLPIYQSVSSSQNSSPSLPKKLESGSTTTNFSHFSLDLRGSHDSS